MTDRAEGLYSASNNRELDIAFMRPEPMLAIDIARVCHEANRAYCQYLGDHSQKHWEDAPQWQRDSAVNGVRFHIENPDAGPSHSHDEWMRHKLADGWKYGPKKDETLKEHPDLVPYEDLLLEVRRKDYLFRAVVHALGHGR